MQNINLTTKILVYTYEEGTESIKKLIDKAKTATQNAYAPYSGFHVGAAALLANGEIATGNNQENAAYPSGLCAERVTLFAANSQHPDVAVEAIAIAAFHDGEFTDTPCCPCGGCRQVIVEVENRFDRPIKVIMYGKSKIYEVESVKDLLPLSFGKESLSE
ncbi:cytidine deaminase [Dysgonomonas sp. PFB1-18]|uniref:cytidine deaminase n=1 Tax=unclassified Dysgonomonas TaxID=2630389 RepID=UPI002473F520|nr:MULTISPECIES: cytidine deaminase [unclassified Dysgonomonas]MDH6308356.1 cytidine deaminase [Dysgonomonas sp. PF1-14]MDH6338207.1 cytidine deaminase [Dysgonomonas sp. PF1-16]MDH6379704.1 cytidine deaminase [Dysgonomonas sp. PFB1-18]MDH6397207.1 cytidine deaminase [Dysgonomonas sp. PF1-23]